MLNSLKYALLAGTAFSFVAPAVFAADSPQIEEIVVMAQRRQQRLQDVPISVNVATGDQLNRKGITSSADLGNLVPGLTIQEQGPAATPFLRGIGALSGNPNDESSVALYVDGVYIASPHAFITDLNNLDRVEVLKGPQGTLFGRNATGGVVQFITRDPSHTPAIEAELGYGNYNTTKAGVYGTTGLGEKLALDFAAVGSFQGDGWGRNVTTGKEVYKQTDYSMRSKLLFTPDDNTKIRLAWDKEFKKNNNIAYLGVPGNVAVDGFVWPSGHNFDTRENITTPLVNHPSQPTASIEAQGVSLNIEHDFDFAKLVSISAWRHLMARYYPAADNTPFPIVEGSLPFSQQQVSQEIQLLSPAGSKIDWVAGYFYFDNNAGWKGIDFSGFGFGPGAPVIGHFNETGVERKRSHSVYAQDTIALLPNLKFTTGIRFTHERSSARWSDVFAGGVSIPFLAVPDIGYDKLTWRVAFDQKITEDVHAYVSYNRGVKGGGFNLLSPGDTGYRPEILDAYEIGVKSELFNRRLRLNAALFKYFYDNIQVQIVPQGGSGNTVATLNAGKAQLQGVDVDFQLVPVQNLTLSGGLTYIHDRYKSFPGAAVNDGSGAPSIINAAGKKLIRTPTFTANLGADYRIQSNIGSFPLTVNYSYNSGYAYEASNRFNQESYSLLNLSAGWEDLSGHYAVYLWANNVTDTYYLSQGVSSGAGDLATPAAPATYGITFKTKWGA